MRRTISRAVQCMGTEVPRHRTCERLQQSIYGKKNSLGNKFPRAKKEDGVTYKIGKSVLDLRNRIYCKVWKTLSIRFSLLRFTSLDRTSQPYIKMS